SFQQVKPTKPELDRLKKKRDFTVHGQNLLEIKREQLLNTLRSTVDDYFKRRHDTRDFYIKTTRLLETTYETIGRRKILRISNLTSATHVSTVDISYIHEMGMDRAKTRLNMVVKQLPVYSFSDTSLHVDILINNLKTLLKELVYLAEMDNLMYRIANDNKKIQRRIDALSEIIIPDLNTSIHVIEEILEDEEREEFIRLKKIKEFIENREKSL
ncbi:MAG: V-type ATP synthase subunit D, partial [Promethearchaeota archaeon]